MFSLICVWKNGVSKQPGGWWFETPSLSLWRQCHAMTSQIAKFMGPTWDPPGCCRPQMGPSLAPLNLISGIVQNGQCGLEKSLATSNVSIWNRKHHTFSPCMLSLTAAVYDRARAFHYSDVIMTTMAPQITSLTVVYSTVYSDADQRKHQSSASLAFVWGIQRDRWIPRTKGQLRGKCFHLMTSSCHIKYAHLSRVAAFCCGFQSLPIFYKDISGVLGFRYHCLSSQWNDIDEYRIINSMHPEGNEIKQRKMFVNFMWYILFVD